MTTITSSTDVDRPAAEVFAYATDPTRFAEWQKGVVCGRMDSAGATKVGDRCETTRKIGFAERPATSELVRFEPPHRWATRGLDGPIRAAVDVTVEARTADSSRLTISIEFNGHGIGKVLVPLVVEREAKKEMPDNLVKLKSNLESDSGAAAHDV
jgi:uncharacterized protein YndB with AHSA1/START domain